MEPVVASGVTFLVFYYAEKILNMGENEIKKYIESGRVKIPLLSGGKPFGDIGVTRSGAQLLKAYSKEEPWMRELRKTLYLFPVTLIHQSIKSGKLSEQNIEIDFETETFHLNDHELNAYMRSANDLVQKNKYLYKEPGQLKVRLSSVMNDGKCTKFIICPVNYYDGLITNFFMDYKPKKEDPTLREKLLLKSENKLEPLNESLLANHIGVVGILESCDGHLIIQVRSNKVANRGNSYSSSVSGSVNIKEKTVPSALDITFFEKTLRKETEEELGAHLKDVRYLATIREFSRGGKPEIYFYAKTREKIADIKNLHKDAISRLESESIISEPYNSKFIGDHKQDDFEDGVAKIFNKYEKNGNITLLFGLILATEFLLKSNSNASS